MSEKATIYDVAKKAGVSLATVSRVLNNSDRVRQATIDKVNAAISELNYTPNLIARGLASKKTTTFGIVLPEMGRQSIAGTLSGILEVASLYGYSSKIFVKGQYEDKQKLINKIVSEQVDGIIFLEYRIGDNDIENEGSLISELQNKYKIPVVLADGYSKDENLYQVSVNYEEVLYNATKHLIDNKSTKIGLVTNEMNYSTNQQKLDGYNRALSEASLQTYILKTRGNFDVASENIKNFIDDNDLDGVVCARDSFALITINHLVNSGRKVPEDVQVIGVQNSSVAKFANPSLTSIDIQIKTLGAVAMRALTKILKKEDLDSNNFVLEHELLKGQSTR